MYLACPYELRRKYMKRALNLCQSALKKLEEATADSIESFE